MVTAFMSYAHDTPEHKEQVRELARLLRGHGIDVTLDQWQGVDRRDWSTWVTESITGADYVIVVASPRYRLAGDGIVPSGQNRGVQYEAALLRDLLQQDRQAWLPRMLPVVLPGHDIDEIPLFLQPYNADHYILRTVDAAGAEWLLRALTRQPHDIPPPLGTIPNLPPRGAPTATKPAPVWMPLSTPVEVVWRMDLIPHPQRRLPGSVEVHLVPTPVAARCGARRLEDLSGELATLGRAEKLFGGTERLDIGSSAQAAWACSENADIGSSGLAARRDGQRTTWFPLPRHGSIGSILDRDDLVDRVRRALAVLTAIDLAIPEMVAPTIGLEPVMFVQESRVADAQMSGGSFRMNGVERLRVPADDTVRYADVMGRARDVADELVARLVSTFREANR